MDAITLEEVTELCISRLRVLTEIEDKYDPVFKISMVDPIVGMMDPIGWQVSVCKWASEDDDYTIDLPNTYYGEGKTILLAMIDLYHCLNNIITNNSKNVIPFPALLNLLNSE